MTTSKEEGSGEESSDKKIKTLEPIDQLAEEDEDLDADSLIDSSDEGWGDLVDDTELEQEGVDNGDFWQN
jgi:hypothetical protein